MSRRTRVSKPTKDGNTFLDVFEPLKDKTRFTVWEFPDGKQDLSKCVFFKSDLVSAVQGLLKILKEMKGHYIGMGHDGISTYDIGYYEGSRLAYRHALDLVNTYLPDAIPKQDVRKNG